MKSDIYAFTHDESCCYFEFVSKGSLKTDRKVVIYSPVASNFNQYNLFLGHLLADGDLCDLTITNNGDLETIMATVIRTVAIFLGKYPMRSVYFTGSTPARIRLYRVIISREFLDVTKYYEIYGIMKDEPEPFQPNKRYVGYLVKLKRTLK
ncbi:hypothetical protein DYBT9623_03076 [Dyadobacter sp. CECT 9623]|uniref:Uncharacterized protein n=1 Tax=Dyadobacter linearis TaxID=2823330 RepID=A0ABM8US57_9BACT|nr:hypothetical protein [Dyadobacter sp. CECT 9623]CAG5070531.1 hypothetical protein DYBT9623_03076 [Dyadobacter sp. CECT 9623]